MEPQLPLHFMVLPFPGQGHINPMLHLSALLTSRHGSLVTFVNTHRSHHRMLESQVATVASATVSPFDLPNIHFVSIPDGITHDTSMDLMVILNAMEKQQELIENLISSSSPPITCIIADSFFPWTQDLANRLGIARVIFWPANLALLFLITFSATGKVRSEGLPQLEHHEIMSKLGYITDNEKDFALRILRGIDDTAYILVNSMKELENSFLQALDLKPPIKCVGPVLLLDSSQDQNDAAEPPITNVVSIKASLLREEVCLEWLDKQAKSSVIYIAFGSIASVSATQIEELALGIEASKQPFLWVARADHAGERADGQNTRAIPQGFLERTREQGLVISWAPQLQVLGHPAISCFLTHCGWNSVVESIFMGVPMLCFPIFGDQPMNAKLVVKEWQVGFGFESSKKDVIDGGVNKDVDGGVNFSREEVKKAVMKLMHSEDGRSVRECAAGWKAVGRLAVTKGGSSWLELETFVQDMVKRRESPHLPL